MQRDYEDEISYNSRMTEDPFPAADFDAWAETYDESIRDEQAFPFVGYQEMLATIVSLAEVKPGIRVLDLGTGTGNLAALFQRAGCHLWCTDFSGEMLARARGKVPEAQLLLHDTREPLPENFGGKFDRIVSAYVFHHFEGLEKVRILQRLAHHNLKEGGRMVIGDIAFPDAAGREEAKRKAGEEWEEEFYWLAKDDIPFLEMGMGFKARFLSISWCAGIFTIDREEKVPERNPGEKKTRTEEERI